MIIHFTASGKNITDSKRLKLLKDIEQHIKGMGHTLAIEWIDEALAQANQPSDISNEERWQAASKSTIDALYRSNVVIVEASEDSFSMGYQVALAQKSKIPILILRGNLTTDDQANHPYSEDKTVEYSLIAADTNESIVVETHSNMKDIYTAIDAFITSNDIATSDMRFNLFLDRLTFRYLQRLSDERGMSRAEIIRQLIKEKGESDL